MNAWLRGPVTRATSTATRTLGGDATSRLSPYLRFGCVSARELEDAARPRRGRRGLPAPAVLARLLRPACCSTTRGNARHEFREQVPRGDRAGDDRRQRLEAWQEARPGFPLVDAGMRQLLHEGFDAQPRAARRRLVPDQGPRHRLARGRALVHALAARRRRGQQQRQLAVDRLGGRRPAAGLPADLQPGAAQERHDPDGAYVRRWVPELADVPDRYLREPWTMPDGGAARGRLRDRHATTPSRSSTTPRRGARRSTATASSSG